MAEYFVIFGSTGHVAKHYIFPALAYIFSKQCLPEDMAFIGVGRRDWTTAQFRAQVAGDLKNRKSSLSPDSWEGFLQRLEFIRVDDLSNPKSLKKIFKDKPGSWTLYFGIPPQLFLSVLEALAQVSLPSGIRLIIEKPFGLNYSQSKALNRVLHREFSEESVFRIDHFLGKPTVSQILDLRFGGRLVQGIWNRHHIEKIEVIWEEAIDLRGRAGSYDQVGALKDMIQNHLLQLLALLLLEPTLSLWAPDYRDKRVDVFRSIRKMSRAEVQQYTLRARYRAGDIQGSSVSDYVRESGVEPERKTETFAQTVFWVDQDQWQGVPFSLRSGKAFGVDRKEINVHFLDSTVKKGQSTLRESPKILRFDLETDNWELEGFNKKKAGAIQQDLTGLEDQEFSSTLAPYGRLFLEAVSGNSTLFVRDDEVEEMWKIIQPISDAWREDYVPLHTYPAGFQGNLEERLGFNAVQGRD